MEWTIGTIIASIVIILIIFSGIFYWDRLARLKSFQEGIDIGLEEGERKGYLDGLNNGYNIRQQLLEHEAFPKGMPGGKP